MAQSDAACIAVLEAEEAGVESAFIARAKLLWEASDHSHVRPHPVIITDNIVILFVHIA